MSTISISGLRWAVRKAFVNHGRRVDEEKLQQMVCFLGLVHVDRWKPEKVGGIPQNVEFLGSSEGTQLIDLHNSKAVEKKLKQLVGENPEMIQEEADDFHFSSAGAHGGFGKGRHE